ncbi:cation efflux family-domain-containing protein [Lipomyces doorenjongii]|uniref:cation efflux family-domain-containing protein n=1 Tax=Lipomyces doorenjongii TaxID=383834 RepID=UPI0034CDAF2D
MSYAAPCGCYDRKILPVFTLLFFAFQVLLYVPQGPKLNSEYFNGQLANNMEVLPVRPIPEVCVSDREDSLQLAVATVLTIPEQLSPAAKRAVCETVMTMSSHVHLKSPSSEIATEVRATYSPSLASGSSSSDHGDMDFEDDGYNSYYDSDDEDERDGEEDNLLPSRRRRRRDASTTTETRPRTGPLSRLYRSLSWAGNRLEPESPLSKGVTTATANLVSTLIAASNTHHNHRSKSVESTSSGRRRSMYLPNRHELRAQYLIGNTKSPYDWAAQLVDQEQLRKMPYRKRKFYEQQNDLIERYIEIDCLLDSDVSHTMIQQYSQESQSRRGVVPANIDEEGQLYLTADARDEYSGIVTLAIMVNFLINVFLLAGKAAIVLLTHSISVIASLVDSALDFLCTTIIWFSTSMVESSSASTKFMYPVGRTRLEPLGVLIFSIIIIVSFSQVAVEAVQRIYSGPREPVELGIPSFAIMSLAVISKLFAWLWCRSINSSAVQALAQDAMSDIVFNLLSILFPVTGYFFNFWWLDAVGALCLSLYIIRQWVETTIEHIRHLTGISGDAIDKQVIMYLCVRFAESIKQVTTINVYHAGDRLHVEVDIVVDDKLTLRDTHDLGEALQYAIETLPMVERAYVHLDYRDDNFVGHIPR